MKLHKLALASLFLVGCTVQGGVSTTGTGGNNVGGSAGNGGGGTGSGGTQGAGGSTSTVTGQTGGKSGSGGAVAGGGAAGTGGATGNGGTPGLGGVPGDGGTSPSDGPPGTCGPRKAGTTLPWLKVVGPQIQREDSCEQVILRGLSLQGIGTRDMTKDIDYLTNTNDTQGTSPGWYPKLLRLPVDTPNPNGQINGVLKTSVEHCTKKGMYCIIDLHYVADPYQNKAAVTSFWQTVAPIYKDYPNVIYEVYNESSVQDTWAKYKPTMQEWVDLIRAAAPKNLIFAGSPSWDQTMGDAGLDPLKGENIVYVVHMYEEHFVDPKNGFKEYPGTNTIKAGVERCAKYHPVVMTEWGFNAEGSQPGRGTDIIGHYGKPILEWLEGMGGSWTAWCASDSWLPRMFVSEGGKWVLRTGQDNMGGFVKDWLYTHRDEKAPF